MKILIAASRRYTNKNSVYVNNLYKHYITFRLGKTYLYAY